LTVKLKKTDTKEPEDRMDMVGLKGVYTGKPAGVMVENDRGY